MENKIHKVYPSKIGLWIILLVLLIFGVGIAYSIGQEDWINGAIQTGILFVVILIFKSISYEINEGTLLVKSFFWFKKEIPIDTITGIQETYNPISAPAASLDRLEVLYGKYNSIVISPKDKGAFIEHLRKLNPKIQVKRKKKE